MLRGWEVTQPAFMRVSCSSGSCSSCPHSGTPLERATLQWIVIQSTILVHHQAAAVHQHNPLPQYLHFQPVSLTRQVNSAYFTPISLLSLSTTYPLPHPSVSTLSDNTQPYPSQPHFLTGTHIIMKAALCKIASIHPQAVISENQIVECSPYALRSQQEQSIREKIFCSIEASIRKFCGGSSPPLPPCYLSLLNIRFNS